MMVRNIRSFTTVLLITLAGCMGFSGSAAAASAQEIDIKVDGALEEFKRKLPAGPSFSASQKVIWFSRV